MSDNSQRDWSTDESLRAILSDAKVSRAAPRDAIERAYTLLVKEKNEKFPHLEWSWYSDTNYKMHLRVQNRKRTE